MKRQVFPIIETIITKRSSAAFVRTIFCRCCRVRVFHFIQLILIAMWLLDLVFMLRRKCVSRLGSLSSLGFLDAPEVLPTKLCACAQPSGGEYYGRTETPKVGDSTCIFCTLCAITKSLHHRLACSGLSSPGPPSRFG